MEGMGYIKVWIEYVRVYARSVMGCVDDVLMEGGLKGNSLLALYLCETV